jgi:hypothetical protein
MFFIFDSGQAQINSASLFLHHKAYLSPIFKRVLSIRIGNLRVRSVPTSVTYACTEHMR